MAAHSGLLAKDHTRMRGLLVFEPKIYAFLAATRGCDIKYGARQKHRHKVLDIRAGVKHIVQYESPVSFGPRTDHPLSR